MNKLARKDLRLLMHSKLNMSQQCGLAAEKPSDIVDCICNTQTRMWKRLFPSLEQVWECIWSPETSFKIFSLGKDFMYRTKPSRRHFVKMKLRPPTPFSFRGSREIFLLFFFPPLLLMGGHRDNAARLFTLAHRDGTKGNKLKDRKF